MLYKLLPTTIFAILALVMVQGAIAVPQIGFPVNCGGPDDPSCPAGQVCCDLSSTDPTLPKFCTPVSPVCSA
ncbi:hypothetical protein B0H14DRAFT_3476290 [Mycena olivaceomarginata]|nr:hypothetical protein B0H14DRAFT_3476290 [Mycena olivaceomarginata]